MAWSGRWRRQVRKSIIRGCGLASAVGVSFGLTSLAAAFASGASGGGALGVEVTSLLTADYSKDLAPASIAGLDQRIISAAREDDELAAANASSAPALSPIARGAAPSVAAPKGSGLDAGVGKKRVEPPSPEAATPPATRTPAAAQQAPAYQPSTPDQSPVPTPSPVPSSSAPPTR